MVLPVSWMDVHDLHRVWTRSPAASANTHLSDLLDLGAALADERAALTGRDDQPQGDGRLAGHRAVGDQSCQVLTESETEWRHLTTRLRKHNECCFCFTVSRNVKVASNVDERRTSDDFLSFQTISH